MKANTRTVRSIQGRPVDLLRTDYLAMIPLPPVRPPIGLNARARLGRDYYVRVDTVDYSVDPQKPPPPPPRPSRLISPTAAQAEEELGAAAQTDRRALARPDLVPHCPAPDTWARPTLPRPPTADEDRS